MSQDERRGTRVTVSGARLSVVIPCLNEASVITRLLQPLQPLRADGHELILVDGGSGDSTLDLARQLVDRALTSRPGRARQMNLGAQSAAGDILWFLHADTRMTSPTAPVELVAAIQRAPSSWGRFDVALSGRHPLLRLVAKMMNLRSRLTGIATGDQGIFVQRHAFDAVGGFPDIPLMEDIEISRLLKRSARPSCLRQHLIASSRRWEQRGILPTILLMWRLRLAYALGADPTSLARYYR